VELDVLCDHYGQDLELQGKKFKALITPLVAKREFFAFKLQATTERLDKGFGDL